MKYVKSILYLFIVCSFLSCVTSKRITIQDDGKIDFTFLQLNDVYEIAPIQGGKYGGLARVETVHQELLKENKNTLLFMAGDFLNPSLLGTLKHEGKRIRGKQMIEVLNAMQFDLVAFGNHEFDLPITALQARLNESTFPWISSNVYEKKAEKTGRFYTYQKGDSIAVHDTYSKELTDTDGTKIRIGFISVCIPSNPKPYVLYKDIFSEATRAYNSIKDQVDLVIGLTHVTIAQDKELLRLLPEIPLIMGGHEHTNTLVSVGNGVVAKADANAKTAYVHRLSFDKSTGVTSIDSQLKSIDDSIVSNAAIATIVEKWQTVLRTKIKEIIPDPEAIIYTTDIPLEGRDTPTRSVQTNLGELITKSMSYAYQDTVDCALVNGGSIRIDDVLEDAMTAVTVFRVLPYGGPVLKITVTGSLLERILIYGEKAAGTGAYLQRHQVSRNTAGEWLVQDVPINKEATYTVAISDYLLKGFDIPFLSEENTEVLTVYRPKTTEIAGDIRKAVVLYLENK